VRSLPWTGEWSCGKTLWSSNLRQGFRNLHRGSGEAKGRCEDARCVAVNDLQAADAITIPVGSSSSRGGSHRVSVRPRRTPRGHGPNGQTSKQPVGRNRRGRCHHRSPRGCRWCGDGVICRRRSGKASVGGLVFAGGETACPVQGRGRGPRPARRSAELAAMRGELQRFQRRLPRDYARFGDGHPGRREIGRGCWAALSRALRQQTPLVEILHSL
jgi:hypothetical protein